MKAAKAFLAALCFAAGAFAVAGDAPWPEWRGPGRDGHAVGLAARQRWPPELERRWHVDVGRGHAAPLVSETDGGTAYVFVRHGGGDRVEARRLADGSLVWRNGYESAYEPDRSAAAHGQGPFSTPLLAAAGRAGRRLLFTYSIDQVLTAWRAADGARVWQRDFGDEFDHPHPLYGNSQSPIFAGGVLVVHAGGQGNGAIYGLDPAAGATRWRIAADGAAYGSFVEAEIGGRTQLVGFTERRLVGLDPEAGEVLWQVDYPVPYQNTVVTPTVVDDHVLVAAWQTPMRSYRVRRDASGAWRAVVGWENSEVAIQHASPVLVGGRLYGHSHRNGAQLYSLDATTGRTLWLGPPRQGDEQAVLVGADPWVLVFRQDGRLEVLRAGDDGYRPRATYRVADGELWAHPAVWSDRILIKDRDGLTLWRVPAPGAAGARSAPQPASTRSRQKSPAPAVPGG